MLGEFLKLVFGVLVTSPITFPIAPDGAATSAATGMLKGNVFISYEGGKQRSQQGMPHGNRPNMTFPSSKGDRRF